MADREHPRAVRRDPIGAGGARNRQRRGPQREGLTHGPPAAAAHADDDRRSQPCEQRHQVPLGARRDPASADRPAHRTFFEAKDRIGQEDRRPCVEQRRVGHREAGRAQQALQIVVGLVAGLVAAAVADEVVDIAEILADDEERRAPVAEPLLPEADDRRVIGEFGAAADPAGAARDADPARLARRDQRRILTARSCRARPGHGPSTGDPTVFADSPIGFDPRCPSPCPPQLGPRFSRPWPGVARPSTKSPNPVVEILPIRVVYEDQPDLPSPRIMLDVLLALPCQANVPVMLGVNEAFRAVSFGESFDARLPDAPRFCARDCRSRRHRACRSAGLSGDRPNLPP